MNIHLIRKTAEKLIIDNSPTILTAVGVVGIVGTAVVSWRAGYKTREIIAREEEHGAFRKSGNLPFGTKEKVQLVWREQIPVVLVPALTVGAVVCANRISASRAAALGAAYMLTTEKHAEYKAKIAEKFSHKKLEEVQTDIAQDGVDKNPPPAQIIIAGTGESMFKDSWSGRYFMSDMESIRRAVNEVNFEIRNGAYCSLTSFYNLIGLEPTFDSDEIGWNDDTMFDVKFSAVAHDGKPVMVFDFDVIPIRGYYQGHA